MRATNVVLAWDPSSDPAVAGYRVYYGCSSRTYTNVQEAGTTTSLTISNLVAGKTYFFAATTFSIAGLESDYSTEAIYTVPGTPPPPPPSNTPPTLDQPSNLTLNQDAGEQTVQLSGISSGSATETQTLTVTAFSGNTGLIPNPTVTYTSPGRTGSMSFTPLAGASGSCVVTVMVDDSGAISNTIIRSFTVTVNPTNAPPTLDAIADQTLEQGGPAKTLTLTGISSGTPAENQTLTVAATSDNRQVVADPVISYTSPAATATLSIVAPTNTYGSAVVTVVVSDGQPLNSTVSRSFKVTVEPAIAPGTLLTNAVVSPNQIFRMTLNPPITNGHKFNFTLDGAAPNGAKISNRKGVTALVWTPTSDQASTTNFITIRATDTVQPTITTNLIARVIVLDFMSIVPGRTVVQAGQSCSLPISLTSSEGITDVSFLLSWPAARYSSPSLVMVASNTASGSVKIQGTNLLVTFQTLPKQVLEGSNVVANLTFNTLSAQSSAFMASIPESVTATKPGGGSYVTRTGQIGEVVIVSEMPLIRASINDNGARELVAYAKPGLSYQVQSSSVLTRASWTPVLTYTQASLSYTIPVGGNASQIWYRLQAQ